MLANAMRGMMGAGRREKMLAVRKRERALLPWLALVLVSACGSATLMRPDGGGDGSSSSDGARTDLGLHDSSTGADAPSDATAKSCKGTPADCSSVSATACTGVSGCTVTAGTCYGTLAFNNCDMIAGSVCSVEAGCTYNSATSMCYSMSPIPCNLRPESTCGTLGGDGCGWNAPFCGGFATPCAQILTQAACGTQMGCVWGS
jgi:hypothetical protein